MRLREYAEKNNISYLKAWRMYKEGKIQGFKNNQGEVLVDEEPQETSSNLPVRIVAGGTDPLSVELASTRSNKAASIKPTDRFKHIDDSLTPFKYGGTTSYGSSDVSVRDAIILCQKAYYNFAIFRTTIDLMTEFSVNNIHFKGGSQKSRDFFDTYFKKINLWKIQDMWFREYFRSGNVFVYRIEGKITQEDIRKLQQMFGADNRENSEIPIRYVILNPADINAAGSISFADMTYYKILSDYELDRLRNPRTEEDREVLENLDPETQKQIKSKKIGMVFVPLDVKNVIATFYKKQDYEAFAVPMGYPVLEDLNFKKELRLMDQAIARTAQQAILLITMGAEPDKGGINPKHLESMRRLFENESVARVVIADYTTEASFIIPQISDILDPKKYETVDRDIALGLNNVLIGQGEKFANQHSKIEIFVERLKHGRQAFLNEFLIPEIKRIAKNIGLKNYPEPYFEDIDLKNELEWAKIYTKLMEIGMLTAEEGFAAIETGKLPNSDNSVESQKKFKSQKDSGLYQPLMGKPKEGEGAGRPSGTKAPQSTKKISPIGASFSGNKIKSNILLAQALEQGVLDMFRTKHKLKKVSEKQAEAVEEITKIIIANEEPEQWINKIPDYLESPVDTNPDRVLDIQRLAAEHGTDIFGASILFASKAD